MTDHFNQLTEAEQERLAILIEECGEVAQAAGKVLRHGYESTNNGKNPETNRKRLARELGDVSLIVTMMTRENDISIDTMIEQQEIKEEKIKQYLHHQG